MSAVTDSYSSRNAGLPTMRPRSDPVVYGRAGEPGLTEHQLRSYQKKGFIFLKGLFTPQEADVMLAHAQRMASDPATRARDEVVLEPNSEEVRSIFDVHRLHPLFDRVTRDARLLAIVQSILGSGIYVHQSRLNLKPGFAGKEFYWHSDFETWHVEDGMPRMRALSCTVLLTENNEFNGPLLLIPGSHMHYIACVGETPADHYKMSLKKQEYGVPDAASVERMVARSGIQPMKGPAGSVVLFDCNAMHGSNSNISPYPRSNLFTVYNRVDNALGPPLFGLQPRPEFIAVRSNVAALEPEVTDYCTWR
jgi:ectoine hydroxylase